MVVEERVGSLFLNARERRIVNCERTTATATLVQN
jgi:hypothetical protein